MMKMLTKSTTTALVNEAETNENQINRTSKLACLIDKQTKCSNCKTDETHVEYTHTRN